jgi:hypothetical protein
MSYITTKDIYNIKYNITDAVLTIGIENTDTFKKLVKNINFIQILESIFLILLRNLLLKVHSILGIMVPISIPIQCERIMVDHVEETDSEIKYEEKMDNYEKQILKLTKQVEEQQKYIDFNDKYVFIDQYRINKYKKHLIIGTKITMHMVKIFELCGCFKHLTYGDKDIDKLHPFLSQKEYIRLIPSHPVGGVHEIGINSWYRCNGSFVFNIHDLKLNYNTNIPYFLPNVYIDIKELLQMKSDILTMSNVNIINFDLLRNFKGTQLHIIDCTFDDINEEDFLNCIETLNNLTSLAVYFSTRSFAKIIFNRTFFKKFKSLKTFVTHSLLIASSDYESIFPDTYTPTPENVDCDQSHISIFKI